MLNKFTPKRLDEIQQLGFYINKIAIVNCKRWFGRYFFVILSKEKTKFVEWSRNTYP